MDDEKVLALLIVTFMNAALIEICTKSTFLLKLMHVIDPELFHVEKMILPFMILCTVSL